MDKIAKFDGQVEKYERLRDTHDKFYTYRKNLLAGVSGSILEIAIGPGFNFDFYKNVSRLTAIDLSPKMIESAEKKWRESPHTEGKFIATALENANFQENEFDAVVSTCSLCAYDNPVEALNLISKWCKPDGKIYLLEHGLSSNSLIRLLQKAFEPLHHALYGCHCNRDIRKILGKSNIEILSLKKPRPFAPIDFVFEATAKPKSK